MRLRTLPRREVMERRAPVRYLAWIFLTSAIQCTVSTPAPELILRSGDVQLSCSADRMLLDIDLHALPTIQRSSLHLQQSSCRPQAIRGSHVTFQVPLHGCGTTQTSAAQFLLFSNVVVNFASNQSMHSKVSYDPEFYYPFTCKYQREYMLRLASAQTVYKNGTAEIKGSRGTASSRSFAAHNWTSLTFCLCVTLLCSGAFHQLKAWV